jgi:hypothetical protein
MNMKLTYKSRAYMYLSDIEDDRGQCECHSSQQITKIIQMGLWAISWRTLEEKQEFVGGGRESVDVYTPQIE